MGTVSRRILLALLLTLGTLCTVRAADRSAPLVYTALYPPRHPGPPARPGSERSWHCPGGQVYPLFGG